MTTRDAFVFELIHGIPELRDTMTMIEEKDDADKVVGELLQFYRDLDEIIFELNDGLLQSFQLSELSYQKERIV